MTRKDSKGRRLKENESQMKDGRYRFRITNKFGKTITVYSWRLVATDKTPKGKKDSPPLRELARDILRDIDDEIDTTSAQMTLNQLLERYFGTKSRLANSTKENYIHIWNKHIRTHPLGNMEVGSIKKSDILAFYSYLYKECDLAITSLQLYQNILYPAFNLAVNDSIIRINPCHGAMKDYVRGSMSTTHIVLTERQQQNLIQFVKEDPYYSPMYPMIVFMLETACRMSETVGMTWKNIDLKKRSILVDHQIIYRKKNGECRYYASKPKGGKAREIPISNFLYEVLSEHRLNTYMLSHASDFEADGYRGFVFLNKNGKPRTPNTITRSFHGIREAYNKMERYNAIEENREAELLPDFTAHVLRHSCCTRWASNGMDIKTLQVIMGHANIQVTMQVYNHTDFERLQKEIERLDAIDKSIPSPTIERNKS